MHMIHSDFVIHYWLINPTDFFPYVIARVESKNAIMMILSATIITTR